MKKSLFVLPIIMFLTTVGLFADIYWSSDTKLEENAAGTAEISTYWDLDTVADLSSREVWFEDASDGRLDDNASVSLGGTFIQGKGEYKVGWNITSFEACDILLSASGPFKNYASEEIDWVAEWTVYGSDEKVMLGAIDGTQPYDDEKLIYRHNPRENTINSTGKVPFVITTDNYAISDIENNIYKTYLYITIRDNSGSQL